MKYAKPELQVVTATTAVVQSIAKGGTVHLDSFMQQTWSNPPAYEADE